jgi:hypothetical protein
VSLGQDATTNKEEYNMSEQEDFFSPNHKRLLSIAVWAKYLAWIVLIIYALLIVTQIIQLLLAKDNENYLGITSQSLLTMLREDSLSLFRRAISMSVTLLKGIVYFLVLKGISLGLNMIVETDINYREQGEARYEQ